MNTQLYELTKAYCEGTASKEELTLLNSLVSDSESARKEFSTTLVELESTRHMDFAEQRAFSNIISKVKDSGSSSSRRIFYGVVSLAACLLLGAFLWTIIPQGSDAPDYTEFSASAEGFCEVTLPDSSNIVLFNGAKLLKPSDFSLTNRNVGLVGEACFDITSDAAHPFVIDAGHECEVTVRGTKFDLSAPEDGESVRLTLLRGSVDFSGPDMNITMSPGESLVYSMETRDFELYHIDVASYEAWLEGNLEFHELPFDVLVEKVCSIYGRKVVLDNALKNKRGLYSIRLINRESLEDVIEALDVMSPLSARYDSSYVYLTSQNI